MLRTNAALPVPVHTTVVGLGVVEPSSQRLLLPDNGRIHNEPQDFNTELVETVTKIPGANYLTVSRSPSPHFILLQFYT